MSYRNYAWAAAVKWLRTPCLVAEEKAVTEAPCPARGLTLEQFKEAGHLAGALQFLASHNDVCVHMVGPSEGYRLSDGVGREVLRAARAAIEARLKEFGMEEPT